MTEAIRALFVFLQEGLCMTLWAFSRRESLTDAWRLLEHAEHTVHSFTLLCFGALLMECEQRGLFDHEIALLKGLECVAGKYGVGISNSGPFGHATVCGIGKGGSAAYGRLLSKTLN